jgi:hypothetical protein
MAERKSLKEGLLQISPGVDPVQVEEFIVHGKPRAASAPAESAGSPAPRGAEVDTGKAARALGRAPLTIRFQAAFATALKRASLERQLKGVHPYTLQDIVEEAVEPWLRDKGYLS